MSDLSMLKKIVPSKYMQAAHDHGAIPEPLGQAVDVDAFTGKPTEQAAVPDMIFHVLRFVLAVMNGVLFANFLATKGYPQLIFGQKYHARIIYAGLAATVIMILATLAVDGISPFSLLGSAIRGGIGYYAYSTILPMVTLIQAIF